MPTPSQTHRKRFCISSLDLFQVVGKKIHHMVVQWLYLGSKQKNITSHKQKQAVAWKILFQYPFAAPTSLSCFKLSLPQSRMDRQRFSLPPSGICFQEKFTTPGTFNIFGFKWKRYNSPALCDHCSNELLLAEASTVYHFNNHSFIQALFTFDIKFWSLRKMSPSSV